MGKAKFSCGTNKQYKGYDSGYRWNGWYCPLFTLKVAKVVINDFNEDLKENGGEIYEQFTYLEQEDAILSQTFENGIHQPEYDWIDKAVIVKGKKYYEIANSNFCWEKSN